MKGIRFYLEYPNKTEKRKATRSRLGNHDGNVLAVIPENSWISSVGPLVEVIGAVYFERNSPVCGSSASWGFISDRCKRISEKQAREIHPRLFDYLDEE